MFDSRLNGSGSSFGQYIVLCSWARHPTVPLSTQVYKLVLANLILRITSWLTSILIIHGRVEVHVVTSCYRNRRQAPTCTDWALARLVYRLFLIWCNVTLRNKNAKIVLFSYCFWPPLHILISIITWRGDGKFFGDILLIVSTLLVCCHKNTRTMYIVFNQWVE